ncbi:S41 family peptidase [Dactylosporangium sp. NPDC049742]|uniref:S41 family peptidase n=1 Tax=Dactylosporangium sp. NPDC049742 TaxID=3154737 RepID=UPI00342FA593
MHLLNDMLDLVRRHYIFPSVAAEVATAIETRAAGGEFAGLDDDALAARVTECFHAVSGDKHLRLLVRSPDHRAATNPEEAEAAWLEAQRLAGHHIAAVQRLDGNVGYIDLRGVASPGTAGAAITAAMELVAHTGALIFDLRRNKGGDPEGVQLWLSYLFPDSDTHLNDIYDGGTARTRQFWTLAYVPGSRYLDRPVYVLTSSFTFSGGEEFAYDLKALGRATLIGEVTRGGAHPTERFPVSPTLEVAVPNARSVNPVTGTNWEGTGVVPDIAVAAGEALTVAHRKALEHILTTSTSHTVLTEAREALVFSSNS